MQVKKQQLELDMEKWTGSIGKRVCHGCILSHWLFNLLAEYIMQNAWRDEAQGGMKIARRNTNNLRYADEWIRKLWYIYTMKYSVQFSSSVISDSL